MYAIANKGSGSHKKFCLKSELREIDLLNNKHIPQIYISNSSENRLKLLAGLLDSDGHYNEQFNVFEITQKNEKLARNIKYLCDTLGFKTSFKIKKATLKSKNYECDVYRVRISGDLDIIPTKVERKIARARKSIINWRQTGIKVEFDKVDDYYGFEIDGNRLFLLEDMTVTHNTSFCLNIATNIALKSKLPVAIFSLEMSKEQITQRIVCSEAEISTYHFRVGNVPKELWGGITDALGRLYNAPLYIDDSSSLTPIEIRAKVRRLKAEHKKVGAVIIDYLQLMDLEKSENRVQEISKITRSLKRLAREMDVPVIALSQLSRTVEQRQNKRPQLSDLRESGCLAGDTLISLAEGKIVPIRELQGKSGFKVWAYNTEEKKFEQSVVSNAFSTGIKPIFQLITRLGRKIKATANHKFLGINGWQRLDKFNIGDKLLLSPENSFKTNSYNDGEIIYDDILSITPNGETEVFDLTVPGPHNFVANEIVAHNSIEQDADIVMFIYRDEYYNPDTDKKKLAELIIAKHRNGPVGTVELFFDAGLTKFSGLEK
jgi:replicative DNA helicase